MSRGRGRIERAIAAAFEAEPRRAFSVEALARIAYPDIEGVEKRHRVAVIRAAENIARRMGWKRLGGGPGVSLAYRSPAAERRPLALDLFCGAGGVSMGLHRAGFDVIGVDLFRQPRYPFPFVQGDALRPPFDLRRFDLIWASPPCQAHTALKSMHNARRHADLIPVTRAMLRASGRPYVIENVPGAPLINPTRLCGSMFGLGVDDAELRRHRIFETSFPVLPLRCRHGERGANVLGVYGGHARNRRRTIGVYGEGCRDSRRKSDRGAADFSIAQGREAMDIDWMTTAELSQAIPPDYAEYLGLMALAR
jgi:DNA (cytosine-5)-methyltransferase 1